MNHCDGYLLCVSATWGRLAADECVVHPCSDFQCTMCGTLECYVDYCSQHLARAYCDGYLACAEVNAPPYVDGRPVCARDPCDGFTCACPMIDPLCFGPDVGYCSELMVDWHHCEGMIACASVSWENVRVQPICVADPCPPLLLPCITCAGPECGVECSETISLNYGWIDCEGERVIDWYCVINCPPNVGPIECWQDTWMLRAECGSMPAIEI